jgi:hypothetical protein
MAKTMSTATSTSMPMARGTATAMATTATMPMTTPTTAGHRYAPAHSHAPGVSQKRMVQIEQDILAKNNAYASRTASAWPSAASSP